MLPAMRFTSALLVLAFAACGESHPVELVDGGGVDARRDVGGDCADPPPPFACARPGAEPGCCEEVPPQCIEGEWFCPRPEDMGWACETFDCGGEECRGRPETCREIDPATGCCGDETIAPVCVRGGWGCPPGAVPVSSCGDIACPEPGRCEALSERECVADDACIPLYDDRCCSTCEPGPCADCYEPVFYECATRSSVCEGGGPMRCSFPSPGACMGETECGVANPISEERCDIPGCVVGERCGRDSCEVACRPITGDSCEAVCFLEPPECFGGKIPEVQEGCFTGWCVPAFVCD